MTDHQSRYRIVHATRGTRKVLGYADRWDAKFYDLAPYAVKLLAERATGELLLIDQETNEVVARRDLWYEARPPTP